MKSISKCLHDTLFTAPGAKTNKLEEIISCAGGCIINVNRQLSIRRNQRRHLGHVRSKKLLSVEGVTNWPHTGHYRDIGGQSCCRRRSYVYGTKCAREECTKAYRIAICYGQLAIYEWIACSGFTTCQTVTELTAPSLDRIKYVTAGYVPPTSPHSKL